MRRIGWAFGVGLVLVWSQWAQAAEHKIVPLDEPPPADEISAEIAGLLRPTGVRVVRGQSRTICDVWLCKEWPLASDKKPTGDVIYPFQPGQLVGVARYPKKASDFRDQDIADGVYTLRYGQQPVDGAHVGTSPTRDFLLLLKASEDKSAATLEYKPLTKTSAQAAASAHPLLLSLQRPAEPPAEKTPSIRHDESKEWWIVTLEGQVKAGSDAKAQRFDLVVVGKAAE